MTDGPGSRAPQQWALLLDWGGVLTAPLDGAMRAWAAADGVDYAHFRDVLAAWRGLDADADAAHAHEDTPSTDPREPAERGTDPPGTPVRSPVHGLERGELPAEDFERLLAAELARRGSPVEPDGLLDRLLAGLTDLDPRMLDLLAEARAAGVRTGLLSNSWGEHYPDDLFADVFDDVVVSGRVGVRKPEPAIFALAAERLDVPVSACVFVDDLAHNVEAARAAGMVAVLHEDAGTTAEEVRRLLGLPGSPP